MLFYKHYMTSHNNLFFKFSITVFYIDFFGPYARV